MPIPPIAGLRQRPIFFRTGRPAKPRADPTSEQTVARGEMRPRVVDLGGRVPWAANAIPFGEICSLEHSNHRAVPSSHAHHRPTVAAGHQRALAIKPLAHVRPGAPPDTVD